MATFSTARVVHLDLSKTLDFVIARTAGYRAAYLCFWYESIPLGHCVVSETELPLGPEQIRMRGASAIATALIHYLPKNSLSFELPFECLSILARRKQSAETKNPSVSVVICTRDRPEALARCLAALSELGDKPHEILVVDNATQTAPTRQLVSRYPEVRYLHEPRPGLSRARNAGIRHTTGEIIAFTDDDVVVSPDWLGRLLDAFDSEGNVMAVTGLVLPGELKSNAQAVFEQKFGFHRGYVPRRFAEPTTDVWTIGAGANMAIRRQGFESVGCFDERLGAGAAGCSEDTELWYRLLEHGFTCQYTPLAVVHHYHRADMAGLRQQLQAYMRGHVAALVIQFQRSRRRDNLRRLLVVLPGAYARQLLRLLILRSDMDARLWWSSLTGYLSGLRYLLPLNAESSPRSSAGRTTK